MPLYSAPMVPATTWPSNLGNVGIGTNKSPDRLHVQGSSAASSAFTIARTAGFTGNRGVGIGVAKQPAQL